MRLSVIIPARDEARNLPVLLDDLRPLRGSETEIIVVDGGSQDDSLALARDAADQVLSCAPGRALQMNHGAAAARGAWLWFVHADTRLTAFSLEALLQVVGQATPGWGRLELRLSGRNPAFRVLERAIAWRSRLSGIVTGDQGLFVHRSLFEQVGGYPDWPLMEDIGLSRALRRHAWPRCLRAPILTSSRRWEQHGLLRTVLLMWWLRAGFYFGVSPERLACAYRGRIERPRSGFERVCSWLSAR